MLVLVFLLQFPPLFLLFGLVLDLVHRLGAWTGSGVNHMMPVSCGPRRQFLPSFDQQDAGVAYLSGPVLLDLETPVEVVLVPLAVCESRAGRLGPADAAALNAAVDLGFMEAEHDVKSVGSLRR